MSKITNLFKKQAKLTGNIAVESLSKEGFTSTLYIDIKDADLATSRTLSTTGPYLITFDPKNTKKKGIEFAIAESASQSSDRVTFSNVLRGLSLDDFDDAGSYSNAKSWTVGTPVGITTDHINWNYLVKLLGGTDKFKNSMYFGAAQNFENTLNFVYTPAYLTCGSSPTTNAATWQISDAEFSITIDGVAYNIPPTDLTGVGNNDQVAKKIETAIQTATSGSEEVEWDGTQFIIRSGDTSSSSAITVLSAVSGGTGTDISGAGATAFLDGDTGNGTVTAKNKGFLISGTVADIIERDALTGVANGAEIYVTSTGLKYDYLAGSWVAREAGGTFPNASTTVAGKKEDPTDAEVYAGTDTGGTGATMSPTPSQVADVIQNSKYTHAVDSSGSDAYAITLTPAITAYADGQQFTFKAGTANTGAATLAVNGLAAKVIKKKNDQDLATGDIEAGQKVTVCYDEDNDYFQMMSQTAQFAEEFTITSQGGSANDTWSTNVGSPSDSGSIDIDVTPFDSSGTYLITYTVKIDSNASPNPGTYKYSTTTYDRKGLLGGSYSGTIISSINRSTSNDYFEVGTAISSEGGDSQTAMFSNVNSGQNAVITVQPPTFSSNNIRFSWSVSGSGSGTSAANGNINASVSLIKLSD